MISNKQKNNHNHRNSQSQESQTQRMPQNVDTYLNKNKMVSSMKTIKSDDSFPGPLPNADIKKLKLSKKQSIFDRTDSIIEIQVNKRNQSNQSSTYIKNSIANKVYYNLDSAPIPVEASFYVPSLGHTQTHQMKHQEHQFFTNIALILFVVFVIVALISQQQLSRILKLIGNLGLLWYTILFGIFQLIWEYLL